MNQTYIRLLLILTVIAASSTSYIYGFLTEPDQSIYTGIRSLNASDYNQHLSFIDQCRKGNFFIKNQFTSMPNDGFLVRPIYFVLSIPFQFVDWSNSFVFHIIRVVCGVFLLITLFVLFRSFELDNKNQLIAFALLTLGSGVGLVARRWIPNTMDLGVPESILFLSLGEAPHFVFSLLLLWTGLTLFYVSITRNSYQFMAGYLLCLAILWWEHPFDAVIMIFVAVATVFLIPLWRLRIFLIAGIGLLSLPPFLYYQKLKSLPAFAGWASSQNLMTSPPLQAVISGLFFLLILAIGGMLILRSDSKKRPMLSFLIIWIGVQLLIIYLPFPFQRRLIAGIQFPLALLASFFLRRLSNGIVIAVVLICSLTNIYVMRQFLNELNSKAMPFYLPVSYKEAFDWLALQKDDGAVLSEFVTGNFIPAYSGHPSFMGHSSLTPDIAKKRNDASHFYRNPDPEFLNANHIRYVFWGNEEKNKNGGRFNLDWKVAYASSNIKIFTSKD